MTYLSGKAYKKGNYTRYLFFVIVFLVVIFFWPFIKQHTYSVIEPAVIEYSESKQSFGFLPEFFRNYIISHKTLAERQRVLEIEIERLENELADKDAKLRELAPTEDTSPSSGSRVVSPLVLYPLMQDVTRLYSTLVLSKGFKDGVTVGATVYLRGNQAVCMIREVYNSSSLCGLLSASGNTLEGVTSSSSITLTLVGRGGYFLSNIARDTPIYVGEKVYLRSDPKMVVGVIKQIANNNQDTSWHAFVEGVYNPLTSSIFYVRP
jgi:cell shape-determining protein MreC